MTILFLILLVIIRPGTDLGFLGFLIGVTGSVAYNLFQLKLGTWIVVAICFVLCAFKFWLDKKWLEPEVVVLPPYHAMIPLPVPVIQRIDALIVAGFYLVWASSLSTNCLNSESCTSCSVMKKLKCGAIYVLWLSPAYIHRVYYSLNLEEMYKEIVFRVDMRGEGDASIFATRLKRFKGVEDVATDIKASKVVAKGRGMADPMTLRKRLKERIGTEVELISPLPKPPNELSRIVVA